MSNSNSQMITGQQGLQGGMVPSETRPPLRSLVKKLAAIMGEVERVAKNGRNEFHRYDYATEADIAQAVRKGMAERSLVLFPDVKKTEWGEIMRAKGGKDRLCTLTVEFTIEDGDSGETRKLTIMGEGTDAGDKASYKALTGAEKYALLKLFLIPTGDDPEKDDPRPQQGPPQRGPDSIPKAPAPKNGNGNTGRIIDVQKGEDEREALFRKQLSLMTVDQLREKVIEAEGYISKTKDSDPSKPAMLLKMSRFQIELDARKKASDSPMGAG